jgi:hypothetical protein
MGSFSAEDDNSAGPDLECPEADIKAKKWYKKDKKPNKSQGKIHAKYIHLQNCGFCDTKYRVDVNVKGIRITKSLNQR